MPDTVILTKEDVRRAIVRIAHEIVENNRGCHDLVFVGMQTRGVPLARRLSEAINDFEREEVPVGALARCLSAPTTWARTSLPPVATRWRSGLRRPTGSTR